MRFHSEIGPWIASRHARKLMWDFMFANKEELSV